MSQRGSKPVTVLHVDDEPGLCEVVADFLEAKHDWLEVTTANGAESALETIRDDGVDAVVSDYDMPGKNGLELLKSVRELDPEIPFILYTGKGSEEIASEAISAGVDDYLQKKTTTDQYDVLANRIRNVVDRQRAQSAAAAADERYHNLIDTAPVPIMLFCRDAEIVYANDAALDFLEADDRSDLDGLRMPDLIVPEDRRKAQERFETLYESNQPVPEIEFRVQTLSDTVRRAVVATAPGTYKGERVAQAIARRVFDDEE